MRIFVDYRSDFQIYYLRTTTVGMAYIYNEIYDIRIGAT